MFKDWKFWLTLLATLVVGGLTPVLLWKVDLSSKSASVKLVSYVSLQAAEASSIPDLRVIVNNTVLETPSLATLEIVNDGSKPILTTDFDGPIELRVGAETKIVRVTVAGLEPTDLKPNLITSEQAIQVKPLLLNPNDRITIAVLTSGKVPNFETFARIAGVSTINIEDATKKVNSWSSLVLYGSFSIAAMVLYSLFLSKISNSKVAQVPRSALMLAGMVCIALTAELIDKLFIVFNFEKILINFFLSFALLYTIGYLLFRLIYGGHAVKGGSSLP